jgi:hypothetical protein
MIKARVHKKDTKIGKTPKKQDSICSPWRRETNAETLKWQSPIGEPGTREKVSLRRINLECNTYVQKSNVSQLPVSQLAKTLVPFYYCLYSLFNKIRDKGKIVSAS